MVEKIKSLRNFLKLPEKQKKAIMLLFSGEMTQAKIAEEVHVSATTLSTWKTHEDFRLGQDEHTVPKVWVDSKRVDQLPKAGLVGLHLNYSTKRDDRAGVNCLAIDWLERAPHGYHEGHIKENSYE